MGLDFPAPGGKESEAFGCRRWRAGQGTGWVSGSMGPWRMKTGVWPSCVFYPREGEVAVKIWGCLASRGGRWE